MFWVCRNTFSESYFALSYRPSFGRMTSPRTDPFSSVATFSFIIGTLPLAGTAQYRRDSFNASVLPESCGLESCRRPFRPPPRGDALVKKGLLELALHHR